MAGKRKPTPLGAFRDNMADAETLVLLAECLAATNQRRMRSEMRDKVGVVFRVPAKRRAELDYLRNPDVIVTFLPGSRLSRTDLDDRRPLLRQALVAGCAATETYLADKVMTKVGDLAKVTAKTTDRFAAIPLNVGSWMKIEETYTRRKRGLRELVVEPYVRERASTAPSQVGELLSLAGVQDWSKKLDTALGLRKGDTIAFLDQVTKRRNRIAHAGDRLGYTRGRLTVAEVRRDLEQLDAIVRVLDTIIR